MFGNVFAPLNASPTPAAPRAAAMARVRQQAAVVVCRRRLGLGGRRYGRMRHLIVGNGPVPLRPDIRRDAPRDIGLVRRLQDDLA